MLYEYLREIRIMFNAIDSRVTDIENGMTYATRYDQDAATPTFAYLGKAVAGTATSANTWQIQLLTFGGDGDVTVTWASGDTQFSKIWDNRASLTYI